MKYITAVILGCVIFGCTTLPLVLQPQEPVYQPVSPPVPERVSSAAIQLIMAGELQEEPFFLTVPEDEDLSIVPWTTVDIVGTVESNEPVRLESTYNLVDWQTVSNFTGDFTVTDWRVKRQQVWYRLVYLNEFLQEVVLAWDPSPDHDIVAYHVYYWQHGSASREKSSTANTQLTISNLEPATTYHFLATAENSVGFESPPSEELLYETSSPE